LVCALRPELSRFVRVCLVGFDAEEALARGAGVCDLDRQLLVARVRPVEFDDQFFRMSLELQSPGELTDGLNVRRTAERTRGFWQVARAAFFDRGQRDALDRHLRGVQLEMRQAVVHRREREDGRAFGGTAGVIVPEGGLPR